MCVCGLCKARFAQYYPHHLTLEHIGYQAVSVTLLHIYSLVYCLRLRVWAW